MTAAKFYFALTQPLRFAEKLGSSDIMIRDVPYHSFFLIDLFLPVKDVGIFADSMIRFDSLLVGATVF